MVSNTKAADGITKHRACDECRSRKLACSKEPDGCSRCKKEGIECYYSPQKQMGRPRKRRHVDESEDAVVSAPAAQQPEQPLLFLQPADDASYEQFNQAASTEDFLQDLSFLDEPVATNVDTWDLLPNYNDTLPFDPQILEHDGSLGENATLPALNLSGVDLLGSINFGDTDIPQEAVSKDLSNTLQQYLAYQVEMPQSESHQSSDTSATPESSNATSAGSPGDAIGAPSPAMQSVPTVSCTCLSTLYLALDSLGNLPNEVIPAMKVARNASKVAHDVIKCTVCSASLVDEPTKSPPMQAFQNLMLLAALVPSACNAYARILEMVDAEVALAKQEGRTFWFSFKDIGGLWGCMGNTSNGCTAFQSYNNKTMAPDLWRLTIRGLLRLDVYGLDESDQSIPQPLSYRQLGLKDVVQQLEERNDKRHAALDAMVAAGHSHHAPPGVIYPTKPCTQGERNCTKVLEVARIALENLVIA
ncbi:uncharacterized protein QYS62_000740 [Fusarium acuminatum]|uniref:Zn(2)-C6 fungal-type domain-containing protein n=1 Tax=Fusarium acuminatum TaxID=5515 RepID=A0ABZ2WGL4_9HYPO